MDNGWGLTALFVGHQQNGLGQGAGNTDEGPIKESNYSGHTFLDLRVACKSGSES